MGWFPFLFYSTLWVGQVMAEQDGKDPDYQDATRAGAFGMLLFSIVAIIAGTLLPYLTRREKIVGQNLDQQDPDADVSRFRELVRKWKAEARRQGRPLKLLFMPFMLRNIWTGALLLFSLLMMSTFFVHTVNQSIAVLSLVGICWAVACWVPFAIIMEFLKEMNLAAASAQAAAPPRPSAPTQSTSSGLRHNRAVSTPALREAAQSSAANERTSLLRRRNSLEERGGEEVENAGAVAGGTILGIHNLAIVMPQFVVALVSSLIFSMVDGPEEEGHVYLGRKGVGWVLRFGGFCSIMAVLVSRAVPPTKAEKELRLLLTEAHEERHAENGEHA